MYEEKAKDFHFRNNRDGNPVQNGQRSRLESHRDEIARLTAERDAAIAARDRQIKSQNNWAAEQADRLAAHIAAAGVTHYGETGDTIRDHMRKHPSEQTVGGVVAMLALKRDLAESRLAAVEKVVEAARALLDPDGTLEAAGVHPGPERDELEQALAALNATKSSNP